MSFVKVENYDGEKAYMGNDRLEVYELNGVRYLIDNTCDLIQRDGQLVPPPIKGLEHQVYRVITENLQNSTAVVNRIKNNGVLLNLARELEKRDNEILKKIKN